MIEFRLTQAPFRMGLAEGDDPHQVPFGSLVEAKNVRWDTSGRVVKRYGTMAAQITDVVGPHGGSTGALNQIKAIATRGNELVVIGSDSAAPGGGTYLYGLSGAGWRRIHKVPEVEAIVESLILPPDGVATADIAVTATNTSMALVAWIGNDPVGSGTTYSGYVQYAIYDLRSFAMLKSVTYVNSGGSVQGHYGIRVLAMADRFVIVWRNANGIYATNVAYSDMAEGTTTLLRNDVRGYDSAFDAIVVGTNFVVAYENSANALKLYSYNTSHVQQATGGITGEAGNDFRSIAMDQSGTEDIFVAYNVNTAGTIRVATANRTTLAQVLAPVTQWSGAGVATRVFITRQDATNSLVGYSTTSAPSTTRTQQIVNATLASVSGSGRRSYQTILTGCAFALNGLYYVTAITGWGTNSAPAAFTSHLLDVRYDDVSYFGYVWHHRNVHGLDMAAGFLSAGTQPRAATFDGNVYVLIPTINTAYSEVAAGYHQGLQLAVFRQGESSRGMWTTSFYDDSLYIHGGTLSVYDGRNVFDYGFPIPPSKPSISASNTASGAIVAGDYIYQSHYEFTSATGLKFRSPMSLTSANTLVAPNDTMTVTVTNPSSFVSKQNEGDVNLTPVHIFFRSTVGGSQPYRLTYEPRYNTVVASGAFQTSALTDISADASIGGSGPALATRPPPYTTGDILDDEQPPSLVHAVIHRGRFWGVDATRRSLWFSKSFQDDLGYAPGFSSSFRILLDKEASAVGSMDDKLIVFGRREILGYILGAGPAPNGENSDLTDLIGLQSDVGCINPRSIVGSPAGLLFQSERGLMLLTRGLEIQWVSRPVKDTLANFPVVTSAVLVADMNEVRWTCSSNGEDESIVLVWNYVENQWSTFEYTFNGVERPPIAGACMFDAGYLGYAYDETIGQVYTIALADGSVHIEDKATHLDEGTTWVPLDFTTAWVSSAGPLGFTSVRSFMLDGTPHTHHKLNVEIGFDNESAFDQGPRTWRAGESGVTEPDDEKLHAVVSIGTRRKCHSIRFRVYDEAPDNTTTHPVTTGKGPSFQMMGIESGLKVGVTKVTSNQSR